MKGRVRHGESSWTLTSDVVVSRARDAAIAIEIGRSEHSHNSIVRSLELHDDLLLLLLALLEEFGLTLPEFLFVFFRHLGLCPFCLNFGLSIHHYFS